jgi:raffinose/stachyose/melibiose transport system permease protein
MTPRRERLAVYLVLGLAVAFALVPVVGIVLVALQATTALGGSIQSFTELTFDNLAAAWEQGSFATSLGSSAIVVGFAVPIATGVCVLAGYGLGALRFPFSGLVLGLFVFALMIPIEATLIPLYFIWRGLGLTDTYVAIIVTEVGYHMPFGVFWMAASFRSLPPELRDAARVDGASSWTALVRVGVPIVLPAIVTLAALQFMWVWNNFLMPLVMLSSESLRTAPLSISFFQGQYVADVTLIAAACVIVALPVVVAYAFLQRQFIAGAVSGALKE